MKLLFLAGVTAVFGHSVSQRSDLPQQIESCEQTLKTTGFCAKASFITHKRLAAAIVPLEGIVPTGDKGCAADTGEWRHYLREWPGIDYEEMNTREVPHSDFSKPQLVLFDTRDDVFRVQMKKLNTAIKELNKNDFDSLEKKWETWHNYYKGIVALGLHSGIEEKHVLPYALVFTKQAVMPDKEARSDDDARKLLGFYNLNLTKYTEAPITLLNRVADEIAEKMHDAELPLHVDGAKYFMLPYKEIVNLAHPRVKTQEQDTSTSSLFEGVGTMIFNFYYYTSIHLLGAILLSCFFGED